MSRGTLGSFNGVVTPNANMVEVFRQKEIWEHPNTHLKFGNMTIRKIGIITDPNTIVYMNDAKIVIPSGTFELAYGMLAITKLVFEAPVNAVIHYIY